MPTADRALLLELEQTRGIGTAGDFFRVAQGIETGRNAFFVLSRTDVARYQLQDYVLPVFVRSNHARGLGFTAVDWQRNADAAEPAYLLNAPDADFGDLPEAVQSYVRWGEASATTLDTSAVHDLVGMSPRPSGPPMLS